MGGLDAQPEPDTLSVEAAKVTTHSVHFCQSQCTGHLSIDSALFCDSQLLSLMTIRLWACNAWDQK